MDNTHRGNSSAADARVTSVGLDVNFGREYVGRPRRDFPAKQNAVAVYHGCYILITWSGAREGLSSNVLLRWRLTVAIWLYTTGIVELAILRHVRTFAGGRHL